MNAWRYLSEDQLCQQSFEDRPEPTTREENRNVDRLFGKSFTFLFIWLSLEDDFFCAEARIGVFLSEHIQAQGLATGVSDMF